MNSSGRRILIVEDEVLIGMVLDDILDMQGHQVIANCASLAEAQAAVEAGGFDVAILDVNIGADPVFPLADALVAGGTPIIFATGSSRDALPARFADMIVLEKPYAYPGVEAALARVPG